MKNIKVDEEIIDYTSEKVQSGSRKSYNELYMVSGCSQNDLQDDSETKQSKIGRSLFGRRTMEETDFQLIESETSMPLYIPHVKVTKKTDDQMNVQSLSTSNFLKSKIDHKIENKKSSMHNENYCIQNEFKIQNTAQNTKQVIRNDNNNNNSYPLQQLENFTRDQNKQKQGTHLNKYENEFIHVESVNILEETQQDATLQLDCQDDETKLLTIWRNVTPSPKVYRNKNAMLVNLQENNEIIESNKENMARKIECARVTPQMKDGSHNRSISSLILAEKYSNSYKKQESQQVTPLKNMGSGNNYIGYGRYEDSQPLNPLVVMTNANPSVYLQNRIREESSAKNGGSLNIFDLDVSNMAYYSSNCHLNSPDNRNMNMNMNNNKQQNEKDFIIGEVDTLIPQGNRLNSEMKSNQTLLRLACMSQDLVETQRRKSSCVGGANLCILQNLKGGQGTAEDKFLALESLHEQMFEDQEAEMDKLVGEYQREIKEAREMSLRTLDPY